ncbi:MAG: hypothetical protein KA338_03200, partial [Chloroflexi bacterium]|nr:hypothetical protein [Chloroflexota bacterium]
GDGSSVQTYQSVAANKMSLYDRGKYTSAALPPGNYGWVEYKSTPLSPAKPIGTLFGGLTGIVTHLMAQQ